VLVQRIVKVLALLAVPGLAVFWFASAPHPLDASALPQHTADPVNGKILYTAAGCVSCHKPGPELKGVDAALPAGGAPFKTPIGTFYPPNLTPDPDTGIGKWTDIQFVNAVQRGLAPDGQHLIPAFPYTSYAHMKAEDVLDIRAYLATLTPVSAPAKPADIPLAFVLRRGVGLWKWLGLDTTVWQADPSQTAGWNRGAYIVNGAGHCNECHTPRDILMLPEEGKKFSGGPHPDGEGKVPSLRDLLGRKRYTDQADLASAFANGEIMGYQHMSAGGMGEVQTNLSKLPETLIADIAAYVVSLK
jgi:mono/diheme cytochrome c family protein